MIDPTKRQDLEQTHHPEAIRRRLTEKIRHSYLGDAVLGGIDGCVTTFAVAAAATGGGFSSVTIIVLGIANLIADGLSMAVSNYQATRTAREFAEEARRVEERHIDEIPEGEREEIRQIFARKGFEGEALETVVDVITQRRDVWIDTMLMEEVGIQLQSPQPLRAALTTFGAFVLVGAIPLLPFLLVEESRTDAFLISIALTALTFFGIGAVRGHLLGRSAVRSGFHTLLTGGAAAAVAYWVAAWLRTAFGLA